MTETQNKFEEWYLDNINASPHNLQQSKEYVYYWPKVRELYKAFLAGWKEGNVKQE